jgi:Spy/CpxP family protein refolding chaperone
MKRTTLSLAGLLLAGLLSAVATAEPPGPGPMMGHGRMFGDRGAMIFPLLLKRANLTPEQAQQVQKIMQSDRDTLRSLSKQLEAANDQLADKLFAPGNVQITDLAPQMQRVGQLRQQLMEEGLKTALAVRAVLKPEQIAKVNQLKDQLRKLHTEMRSILEGSD